MGYLDALSCVDTAVTHPLLQISNALYAALSGTPEMQSTLGPRVYRLQPPPGAPFPYVIYQQISGGYTNDAPRDNINVNYQIVAWSTAQAEAYGLADVVDRILQAATLALPDWSNYWLSPNGLIERVVWNNGQEYFGVGAEYNIRADRRSMAR